MVEPSPTVTEEKSPGLIRALGPGMAMAMVIGNVIGGGIVLKPSAAAAGAGDFSIIFLAWIVGGISCILGALCFAELAVMLPQAGGIYVYLREAYGRTVAFIFAWSEFLFGRPASIAALSVATIFFSSSLAGKTLAIGETLTLSVGVVLALTAINLFGVIWGGRVQGGTTIVKAGFLICLAVLPLLLMTMGYAGISSANYSTQITATGGTWIQKFSLALMAVLWSYNGWHAVTPVAEEVRNPNRNLPLALFGGLGLVIIIYLAINLAYHGVLSMEEIKQARFDLPQRMMKTLLAPFGESWVETGVIIVTLATICSVVGSMNTNLMNGPRVVFALGRTEPFAKFLSRVHPQWHTPWVAILVQGGMAVVMLLGSEVLRILLSSERSLFDILTDYVIYSSTAFYMLTVAGVIVLRYKHPEWSRPHRTVGYPLVPILFLLFSAGLLYYVALAEPLQAMYCVGLSLAGLIPYGIIRLISRIQQ